MEGIHYTTDGPPERTMRMECHDCGSTDGAWVFLEKESFHPAPDVVSHSLTVKFKQDTTLVLLVAHCENCGSEEEFYGELPHEEQHGYTRIERIVTQHERARHRPGSTPLQVVGAGGMLANILSRRV